MLFGPNFYIFALFRIFQNDRKIVKYHELTPLLFSEIFPPQKFSQILLETP